MLFHFKHAKQRAAIAKGEHVPNVESDSESSLSALSSSTDSDSSSSSDSDDENPFRKGPARDFKKRESDGAIFLNSWEGKFS